MNEITGSEKGLVNYLGLAGSIEGRTVDASFKDEDEAVEFLTALSEPGQTD